MENNEQDISPYQGETPANSDYIKMDYTITDPQERVKRVEDIIANTPAEKLTNYYLTKLADYIIFTLDKEEKKEKKILTSNRMMTVNARETSFEGMAGKMENGEDGIYNLIANDKNIIFKHKAPITEEDIKNIPGMAEFTEEIKHLEEQFKQSRGKKAYALKKQIISMYQDRFELKSAYYKPIRNNNLIKSMTQMDLSETITVDKKTGEIQSNCLVNLFNPKDVSLLLCNYSKLKEDSWEKLNSDMRWMMEDLDTLTDKALAGYPYYYDLLVYKIDGMSNIDIQQALFEKYGIKNSVEYLSSLWRNKIPKMIAEEAQKEALEWYYTNVEKGYWKKCGRCGKIKLGHNLFFSKNKTSKDQLYSICKECRNAKTKEKIILPKSAVDNSEK